MKIRKEKEDIIDVSKIGKSKNVFFPLFHYYCYCYWPPRAGVNANVSDIGCGRSLLLLATMDTTMEYGEFCTSTCPLIWNTPSVLNSSWPMKSGPQVVNCFCEPAVVGIDEYVAKLIINAARHIENKKRQS